METNRRGTANMTVLEIRFTEWLQRGFQLFLNNAVLLLLCGLVAGVLSVATFGFLTGPMLAGLAWIILQLMNRQLAVPALNDLFRGFQYFKDTLPVTLFFYALGISGYVLLALPVVGQLLYTVLVGVGSCLGVLSIFHLVAARVPPLKSYRSWFSLFTFNWGPLLGFFILVSIIQAMGIVALFVGLIVTMPLSLCILAAAYEDISRQSAAI